jgi:DNA recombination-dependent growth factor C
MGLLQGAFSLKRFLVLGPVPEEAELMAGLDEHRFRPFEDGLEEERSGFVDWRNPLIIPPDPVFALQDRFALFALRIDTRRVPALLLRAEADMRLQQVMKEKDLPRIGKETRISVQDEVKVDLLRKVLPTPRMVEVAWDLKGGILWTTASSSKTQGLLATAFHKAWGLELQPLAPLLLAGRLAPNLSPEALMALDPLDLSLENA